MAMMKGSSSMTDWHKHIMLVRLSACNRWATASAETDLSHCRYALKGFGIAGEAKQDQPPKPLKRDTSFYEH